MFPQLLVLRSWLNGIRLIPYPAFPPIVPKLLHYLNNQAHPLKEPPKQSLENKKKTKAHNKRVQRYAVQGRWFGRTWHLIIHDDIDVA